VNVEAKTASLQGERVSELLELVLERNPFQRARLEALELGAEPRLAELPPLSKRELVVRAREMIHADVHVAFAREPPDRERHDLQLLLRRWQIGVSDAPTLHLITKQFAVLGNLTSGPIMANGSSLPAPWNGLNIHV